MMPAELGMLLARARRQSGTTQKDLAARMGTTQSAISRIEAGWGGAPTVEWIDRFAAALGQPVTITFGTSVDQAARRRRFEQVLGPDFEQDPWRRHPSRSEARSLIARGLTLDIRRSRKPASQG